MKTRVARIRPGQLLFGASQAARSPVSRAFAPFARSLFSSTQPSARTRARRETLQHSALLYFRFQRSALARRFRSLRFNSNSNSHSHGNSKSNSHSNSKSNSHSNSKSNSHSNSNSNSHSNSNSNKPNASHHDPTPHLGSPEPAQSLSQKLKALSKEYGWAALGVYLALSALDFPVCFLAVRLLGTDRIGHYEEVVKDAFWNLVRVVFPTAGTTSAEKHASEDTAEATLREGSLDAGEVAAVKARNGGDASIWTQLGLAYLVHKSLIFFRVPLTAAVLPKVVKTLRKWGYNIGKKKPKTD
ncbi:DUF1279 super [Ascochyta rabiei]|uniref:DUF1279 super n=1 Tax=Didymella rabiei TaxID=5454 RepID=UPI0021FBD664|nr:DUF1279 super [Ascochyta rabiei]UPX16832.1 DUF1279 super [Ascochyta rabiei]